jgi:hypothetical protein
MHVHVARDALPRLSGIPVRNYEGVVELRTLASGTHISWSSSFRGKPSIAGPLVRRSLQAQFPGIVRACAAAAEARDRVDR